MTTEAPPDPVSAVTLTSADAVSAPPIAPPVRPERAPRPRLSWRQQRWERRRKRRTFEEVLGWVLVPLILVVGYWAVRAGLNAMGTSPTALVQGIRAAISGKGG